MRRTVSPSSLHFARLRTAGGFTLIEVMIAVAVVSILTALAMPSMSEWVRRAARTDAQATLLQAATYLERRYAECNSYLVRDALTDPPCTVAMGALPAELLKSPTTGTTRYNITYTADSDQSYTIRAAPVQTDSRCGTLTINSSGARGFSGNGTVDYCWRR